MAGLLRYVQLTPPQGGSEGTLAKYIPFPSQFIFTAGAVLSTKLAAFAAALPFTGTRWRVQSVNYRIIIAVIAQATVERSTFDEEQLEKQILHQLDIIKNGELQYNFLKKAYELEGAGVTKERIAGEAENAQIQLKQGERDLNTLTKEKKAGLTRLAEQTLEANKGALRVRAQVAGSNQNPVYFDLAASTFTSLAPIVLVWTSKGGPGGNDIGRAIGTYLIELEGIFQLVNPIDLNESEQLTSVIELLWSKWSATEPGSNISEANIAVPVFNANYELIRL